MVALALAMVGLMLALIALGVGIARWVRGGQ
jgi:hypothetical protein